MGLFLQGKSCEEIRRLNPGFSLGAIVAARLSGKWDEQRTKHLTELQEQTKGRVQQSVLETVDVMCDLLAAKNKLYRDKVLKFIQTGDEEYLRGLDVAGLKGYKEIAEALMKLTGQDGNKKVTGIITHVHEAAAPVRPALPAPEQNRSALAYLRDKKLSEIKK